ncbi:MAG: radical SAM protein [bacterium]
MKKLDILLVGANKFYNFPVRVLHAVLDREDGITPHSVFVKNSDENDIRFPTKKEEKFFIGLLEKINPRIVGLSVLSPNFPVIKRLAELVRENSSAIIVTGGIHSTIAPETCFDFADIVCIGEGENALVELCTAVREDRDFYNIENFWFVKDGQLKKNPLRPLIQDLDSLPFASFASENFHFIEANKIWTEDPCINDTIFYIHSSRGCPFVCSYCVNSILHDKFRGLGPFTRRRSVGNVIEEIREATKLSNVGVKCISFLDEVFSTDEEWLNEFEKLYSKEINLPFLIDYNPKNVEPWRLEKLAAAGLYSLCFGIQTGSDYVRNKIFHRPGKNDEIVELSREIHKFGITAKYDLIMNIPYDTEETMETTLRLFLGFPKPFKVSIFSLQYFPNYKLTQKALADGFITEEHYSPETLMKAKMIFVPGLFPFDRKGALQNFIWMFCNDFMSEKNIRKAVFQNTAFARTLFWMFFFKSIIFGILYGNGGIRDRLKRRIHYTKLHIMTIMGLHVGDHGGSIWSACGAFYQEIASHDFAHKVAETTFTRVFLLGIGMVTGVIIARIIGPEGKGLYAVAVALGATGMQFGNFGLHASNTYYVAKDRKLLPALLGNSLMISVVMGGLIVFVASAAFSLWPKLAPVTGLLLVLALVWIPFGLGYMLLQNLLLGLQEVRAYNKMDVANGVLGVALVVVLAAIGAVKVELVFAVCLFTTAFCFFWALRRLWSHLSGFPAPSLELFLRNLRYGFKSYLPCLFAFFVTRIDLFIIMYMTTAEKAGLFSVAMSITNLALMVPLVIGTILFPKLSALENDDDKLTYAKKTAVVSTGLTFIILCVLVVVSNLLIPFMYGEQFRGAAAPFFWLAAGAVLFPVYNAFGQLLAAMGNSYWLTFAWAVGLAFKTVFSYYAVRHYGYEIVGLGNVFVYLIVSLITLKAIKEVRIARTLYA